MHVVPCASRLCSEERASVDVLPKNSCGCEAPGRPGRTIGSSGAEWLKRQSLKKFVPRGDIEPDSEPSAIGTSAEAPTASSRPPASIIVRSVILLLSSGARVAGTSRLPVPGRRITRLLALVDVNRSRPLPRLFPRGGCRHPTYSSAVPGRRHRARDRDGLPEPVQRVL